MDKRYQVFVSSTFVDLQEERREVMQALLELDCIPAGMELFPASNDDQWSLIKRVIDDSDYYILIIGGRYGSTTEDGISYTQKEFEYALATGKPIISFLHRNPENIPAGKSEKDEEKRKKLEAFKELAQKKLVKYWEGADNLGSVVSRSMVRLIKDFPAEGWVKSGSAVDEKSIKEIARLQRENEELRNQLVTVATEAPKGSDKLAQGEDEVDIDFTFTGYDDTGYVTQSYDCAHSLKLTWNMLFGCIAPLLIDESDESDMYSAVNGLLKSCFDYEKEKAFKTLSRIAYLTVDTESFNLIKVQLRALGLICLGDKKRSTSDHQTYWKLTPYGDYVMTTLLAICR